MSARKRKNISGVTLAKMIAEEYVKYFGPAISSGKGEQTGSGNRIKNIKSPYDRVCDVLEKYYGTKMSQYARTGAVEEVRKGVKTISKKS